MSGTPTAAITVGRMSSSDMMPFSTWSGRDLAGPADRQRRRGSRPPSRGPSRRGTAMVPPSGQVNASEPLSLAKTTTVLSAMPSSSSLAEQLTRPPSRVPACRRRTRRARSCPSTSPTAGSRRASGWCCATTGTARPAVMGAVDEVAASVRAGPPRWSPSACGSAARYRGWSACRSAEAGIHGRVVDVGCLAVQHAARHEQLLEDRAAPCGYSGCSGSSSAFRW